MFLSARTALRGLAVVVAVSTLHACVPSRDAPPRGAYLVDSGGRVVSALEVGASMEVGATGLEPGRHYDIELRSDGELVSYARLSADIEGRIEPFHLWYHSGVVGCSIGIDPEAPLPPFFFRTFEEAEAALEGRELRLTLAGSADPTAPPDLEARAAGPVADAATVLDIPTRPRRSAMVYPSDSGGCLTNSAPVGEEPMFVSGRNFEPGERLEVHVVANQRRWFVGDVVRDLTGVAVPAPVQVSADDSGRFTAQVWDAGNQMVGAYDIVVRRDLEVRAEPVLEAARLGPNDVVSYASDTAFLLFLYWPPGAPLMDIAGRPLLGSPYFEFADSFAETGDPVWGAVDPTLIPPAHPGGTYGAYFVVNHKTAAQWDPAMGGSTALADVSGGVEITRIKAGCINGTDVMIWNTPLALGDYDVVVNFGSTPATSVATYTEDLSYDETLDFLDGAVQVGFTVAVDPYELGSMPFTAAAYSFDDEFPSLGTASNVDLRAVVRYPTASAVTDDPAPGQHPIFLIQHGNHASCSILTTGQDFYDFLRDYFMGLVVWDPTLFYDHATCPVREPNHEGYTRLLEILASNGIIAVSIDAYDLTGAVPGYIAERGDLILRHLEFWSHLNDPTTFTAYTDPFAGRFNNHVDLSRISVSGHSRGGEASVAAYIRNALLPVPFNIGSVSSIAPVDFNGYSLTNVPYFVILPAADGDVSNLSGVPIYDRTGGVGNTDTKSSIHVYGANHNYFNTVWAADWDDSWTPRDDFIPAADQQTLGEAYLSAFTRIHLTGETVYEDMLRGRLVFPSTSGRKIHHTRHEANHSSIETGSAAGVPSGTATEAVAAGPSVHTTNAVTLGWTSSTGTYTYTVPAGQRNLTGFQVLGFRVTQTNNTSNPSASQAFTVSLKSGAATKAAYTLRFDEIPEPYDRKSQTNLGAVTGDATDHNLMTSVRIPLQAFIVNQSGVDLTNVDTVEFRFLNPNQGEIHVDDIEFSR